MLGFRLNKLGAAMRSGLDLRSLYGGGASGFLPKLDNADYDRQLYNAPATTAASAGDPIGLWLPSQSPADVVNLLVNTDRLATGSQWAATATIAGRTADVANTPEGVPTADLFFEATTATGERILSQDFVLPVAQVTYHFVVSIKAAGRGFAQIRLSSANGAFGDLIYTVNLSNGATVNSSAVGAASGLVTAITTEADGYYRVLVGGLLSSDCTIGRVLVYLHNGSTTNYAGVVGNGIYVCKAQAARGTTELAYQPNAGSLGGSNRRTGGSNMLLWTQELSNSYYTPTSCTVTENTVAAPDGTTTADTLTEATGAGLLPRLPFGMTVEVGQTYTISIYAKETAGSKRYLQLYANAAFPSTSAGANFDLATGIASNVTSGYTAAAVSVGNGWWRCYVTTPAATGTSTGWRYALQDSASAAMAATYNPDGTGSMYLWGAQVNIGSLATYSRNMDQLGGLLLSAPLFQSTSANRGTLARRPASGIRNLLGNSTWSTAVGGSPGTAPTTWSIGFGTGAQTTTSASTIANTAVRFDADSGERIMYQALNYSLVSGQTYTFSAYLESVDGNIGDGILATAGTGTFTTVQSVTNPVTTGRKEYIITCTGSGTVSFRIGVGTSAPVGATVHATWSNPQLESRNGASALQYVTSAADITESGQPDVWHTLWDGISDFGTFGVQSYGSASLYAAAGQAWTVWGVFRTTDTTNNLSLIAKGGSTLANRTLQVYRDWSSSQIYVICRGHGGAYGEVLTTGQFVVWALRWNGTSLQLYVNRGSPASVTVGSAAEEAQNITVSVRTESSPVGAFNGHNDVAMIDRALSDAEMAQLMSNLNAVYRAGL